MPPFFEIPFIAFLPRAWQEPTEINFVRGNCKNLPILTGMRAFCPHFSGFCRRDDYIPSLFQRFFNHFLQK
jgi:hypothetical protein